MTRRKRGRAHGGAMMMWLFFANLFDPAKKAAIEQLQKQRRIGDEISRTRAGGRPGGDEA